LDHVLELFAHILMSPKLATTTMELLDGFIFDAGMCRPLTKYFINRNVAVWHKK
jgi:hypothetical protein